MRFQKISLPVMLALLKEVVFLWRYNKWMFLGM